MRLLAFVTAFFLWAIPVHAQEPVKNCQPGTENICNLVAPPIGNTASAVENSHVMKARPGTLSKFQANNTNAAARWVMLVNATTAPINGALLGCTSAYASGCVLKWYQIAANFTGGDQWSPGPPLSFPVGLVMVCSSTGPFTLTLAADCTFSAEVN